MGAVHPCCATRDATEQPRVRTPRHILPLKAVSAGRGLRRAHTVSVAVTRARECADYTNVAARYHRQPARLEDDYSVDREKVLGEGGFASVCLAADKSGTSSRYAIKSMSKVDLSTDQAEELEAEIEIFLAMDHPNVVRLMDIYDEPEVIHMVMEAMDGGELLKRLEESGGRRFDEELAAHTTWHMLLAVNYLHSQGIAHRDLKLENFLYEEKGYNHLKLADFGFGKRMGKGSQAVKAHDGVGTLYYLAPEVLEGDYDEKCDMWSFGVIIWLLLTGTFPFVGKSPEDTMEKIHEGHYSIEGDVWDKISPEAKCLVRKLLIVEPTHRIPAEDALKHPWISAAMAAGREKIHDEVAEALVAFADASRFKRLCLSVMAIVLPSEERDKVRRQFIGIDSDNTGQIGEDEIRAALKGKCDDETVRRVFKALDTSGGGQVTYSEFLAATLAARNVFTQDMVEQTFHKLDRDRRGYITEENFKDVLGSEFSKFDISGLFTDSHIDEDGDGKISCEELRAFLQGTSPIHQS